MPQPDTERRHVIDLAQPLPIEVPRFTTFEQASRAVLRELQDAYGFGLWMVTRRSEDDWIILTRRDMVYGVEEGDILRWSESFCSRMVTGEGPSIAPDATEVPAYRDAEIGQQLNIGAYVGIPLMTSDGALFGTLCAIDPVPQPRRITRELPLIQLLGGLLSTILSSELDRLDLARKAEHAALEAHRDALTGVGNRRAWDALLEAEEARCARYGHPACIVIADANDLKEINDAEGHLAGDRLLRDIARTLSEAVRETDSVCRLGGDEFGILFPECSDAEVDSLLGRVRAALEREGLSVSIGWASRHAEGSLVEAWNAADARMYSAKNGTTG